MFERYTEKMRRVIFFARYEASQLGSSVIDSEHILLGVVREEHALLRRVLDCDPATVRNRIEEQLPKRALTATSVDLPLSETAKQVLNSATAEADRLNHKYIGTEHLLLALVEARSTFAGKLLAELGADPAKLRALTPEQSSQQWANFRHISRGYRPVSSDTVEIHGRRRNADYVRDVISMIRSYNWHWQKSVFKPRDIVIHRRTGQFSFDLSLAEDHDNFILVKEGWTKDHCFVCRWELFESDDDEHGRGYTNGRNWLCIECCERFVQRPDYFTSSHSEMT
jgi:hypothetical protein